VVFHGCVVQPTCLDIAMNSQTEKLLNTGLTLVRDAGSAAAEKIADTGTSLVRVAAPKAGKLARTVVLVEQAFEFARGRRIAGVHSGNERPAVFRRQLQCFAEKVGHHGPQFGRDEAAIYWPEVFYRHSVPSEPLA